MRRLARRWFSGPWEWAARRRLAAEASGRVTIRRAVAADAQRLAAIATLAEASPLWGDVIVAEVDGTVCAAVTVDGGVVISDPFRATRSARTLLELRRRHLLASSDA